MKPKVFSDQLERLTQESISLYPFYHQFVSGNIGFKDLPLTDKRMMTRLRDQFELPDQHIVHESFTSGTTGVPFRCIKNAEERFKLSLALFKQRKKWGLPLKHKMLLMSNRALSEPKVLRNYAQRLVRESVDMLQGRASSIVALCQYMEEQHLPRPEQLKFVQNWGETLHAAQREYVEHILQAPFVDYYGLEEMWMIAFSNEQMELEVDEELVYVEVIDPQSGEEMAEGQHGEIVVTSFIMRSLPFIRYRTGDIGRIQRNEKGKMIIQLLPVRSSQIQLPGRQVSASTLRYLDRFFYELSVTQSITQFQMIQETYFQFRLKVVGQLQEQAELQEKLRSFLTQTLEQEITLYIEQVKDIAPDPASGKFQSFITLVS